MAEEAGFRARGIRCHVFPSASELAVAVANEISLVARQCIAHQGAFHVALAGGRSTQALYDRLSRLPNDWAAWRIYFTDERCLPASDPDRNSSMIRQAFAIRAHVSASHIHDIPAELGPERGARRYQESIDAIPGLDLALLGLGEDGHIASLFPGAKWGAEDTAPSVLPVMHSPKPPAERISLSARMINSSARVWCLAVGKEKRQAVKRWRAGDDIPASVLVNGNGVDIWADEAAWLDL